MGWCSDLVGPTGESGPGAFRENTTSACQAVVDGTGSYRRPVRLSDQTAERNRYVLAYSDRVATAKRAPAGAAVLRGDITVAIRNAVMQELAEMGYGRLSIEAVARRAGVGKTAIYRRWGNKLEMVLEIVSDVAGRSVPPPHTRSFAGGPQLLLMIVSPGPQHPIAPQIIPGPLGPAPPKPPNPGAP